ncbi:MAG: peptidylprolyl isomerase [Candidatus Riflebacteria bacterium]|nr:peptidylprolyl isomerase [Candidatus Riflebacteria bacterium]
MARVGFMSMRWLRMHIKEIIWATVILFVLSCFIIGYGTSRAQRSADDRRKKADMADQRQHDAEEAVPANIKAKFNMPALSISLPNDAGTASMTRPVYLKSVYQMLASSNEYKKLMSAPAQLRAAFTAQLKENAVQNIIAHTLLELYAEINKIKPPASVEEIVQRTRSQISPVEFDRQLKKSGMTADEFGQRQAAQEVLKIIYERATKAIPVASASEDVIMKYYEDHKLRFKKDDDVSVKALLIAPGDFAGKVTITDEDLRRYYEEHRADFMSSSRVSVRHILVDPANKDYLAKIDVQDADIRKYYSDHNDQFKKGEEVKARHILIRPKDHFEKTLDNFSIKLSEFKLASDSEKEQLYTFDMHIGDKKTAFALAANDISLTLSDGKSIHPTTDNADKISNPLVFPMGGTPASGTSSGAVAFLLPKGTTPATLTIKDGNANHTFNVSAAHDEEKAFVAAEEEAKKIAERIQNGADFSKLAEETSEDPGSKIKGGDLGSFGKGQMVKPFEEAAFAANIGEVKGPVRTQFGYHLIKVDGRTPAHTRPIDEVHDEIVKKLKKERATELAQQDIESYRDIIEAKSRPFQEVARANSMGASKKDDGRLPIFYKGELVDMPAELSNDRKILEDEVMANGQLIPEIEDAVFALKPGELSRVIKTQKGFHLFQLESQLPPIQFDFVGSIKSKVRDQVDEKKRKDMAAAKAAEIAKEINATNFVEVAKEAHPDGPVTLGPLPYGPTPGYSNYALTGALGQLSIDGRTYLPEIHKAIGEAYKAYKAKDDSWKTKVYGPITTDLGSHFLMVTNLNIDQYKSFADVKDRLTQTLTQEPKAEDINAEFEKNASKFDKPATRKIRQIVVNEEELAKEIHKRLVDGEIFSLLAQNYSVDGTKAAGGLVGSVKHKQLPANLEEAVWKLKKGEFTAPIQTSYGYTIVYLEEDEDPGQKAALTNDIRDSIKKQMKQNLQEELFEGFIDEIKNRASIIRNSDVLAEL